MPVDLSGNWQQVQREGFEEYLRSIGTPEDNIKEITAAKLCLIIKQSGDNNFEVTSGFLRETQSYVVGTPFDSEVNGQDVTTVASWEGDRLVMKTTSPDAKHAGKEHITTRELVGGKLVQKVFISSGPVSTGTFEKK